jgi:GH24 family phage-related lysozyme (muramidase)
MKICFPARKKRGKEYTSVDEIMTQLLGEPHGGWLAGSNLLWHGGLHISTVTAPDSILTAETVDTAVPLQFMAGGEVVAWRLNKEYLTSQYNGQTLQYSTTFVLVKSVCQPDPKNDKTWLEFYTLYMGLAPLSEFPETACWSVTDKGDGLRKRQYSGTEKEGRKAPIPAGGSLKKGTRIAVMKQTVFELDGKSQPFGLAKALNEKGEITGKPFWISLAPDYMKKESPQYAHLPVWMQQTVKQGTFDEVVRPAEKLEVAAGDAAGFLSKDVDPVGMGKVGSSHFVHIEVLSSDVRMPAFLDNPGKITVGKQYIRVHSGKSVYQKTGSGEASTFKAMSCVIVKDSGKILPADKCHPLKDAQGKTWYEISPGNWMSESDVDVLHQYDLKERGFTALKEESTADMSKSLREGWMKSLLNRLSEMVNRERGIQQQQVSDYYKKAVNHIDTDGDGELSSEELFYAVHHPEMEIRNITARMVVRHDSEWSGDSSHHKWEVYFKNYDLLRMQYAKQWRDDVEWMSQVEAFKGGASVWHMHPVMFLDAIADKFGDTIDFQTSLGIYRISKKSAEFILSWEAYVSKPYVPAGDQSSGITVGYGYDLGQQTTSSAREVLSKYYSNNQVERLLTAIGKKGDQARAIVHGLSDIIISKDNSLDMAMFLKQRYCQKVVDAYPQAINLPPDSAGAMLSLIYNRGPSLALPKPNDPIDSRREMREIRDDFSAGNIRKIPGRLRSMKRLWDNQRGLIKRREGEAQLIENEIGS